MSDGVPNLDAMDTGELLEFANKHFEDKQMFAFDLFPHMPEGYDKAAFLLAAYARMKRNAMLKRITGQVDSALVQEEECDKTYNQLPDYARW